MDSQTWDGAIDDFAEIDAHSSKMVRTSSQQLQLCDERRIAKKSIRASWGVLKRLPVDFLLDIIGDDEYDNLLAKHGQAECEKGAWRSCNATTKEEQHKRDDGGSIVQTAERAKDSSNVELAPNYVWKVVP